MKISLDIGFLIVCVIFIMGLASYVIISNEVITKTYCGEVMEKYMEPSNNNQRSERHIVFFSKELKRHVDVKVSNNLYVNTFPGEEVCYELSHSQIKQ